MVSLKTIRASNALLSSSPSLTFVFAGATSGIGLATLKTLARCGNTPKAYIIGRSLKNFQPHLDELRSVNPEATWVFLEAQITSLKEVKRVCDEIKSKESKVDVLCLSPGYLTFNSQMEETEDGLDADLALKYYSRLFIVHLLLPLLLKSEHPRVLSILAAGREGALTTKDLESEFHENFTRLGSQGAVVTMTTLSFEELAKEYPTVTFSHVYPGGVRTDVLQKLLDTAKGWWRYPAVAFRWLVAPWLFYFVLHLTPEEAGERQLFNCTSGMYPAGAAKEGHKGGAVGLVEGLKVATSTLVVDGKGNGVYRINWNNEVFADKKMLAKYREDGLGALVWQYTLPVFNRVLGQ